MMALSVNDQRDLMLQKFLKDESAVATVEYAMTALLFIVALIAAIEAFASN